MPTKKKQPEKTASGGLGSNPGKAAALVGVAGLLAASLAFVLGMIVGAQNAGSALVQDRPNPGCVLDLAGETFNEKHAETRLVACQVTGMTEAAAIDFIAEKGITHRVAARDGEGFALTEDYSDSRINLTLMLGIVVVAEAW